jgi:putative transferase (TIGR04331 family)
MTSGKVFLATTALEEFWDNSQQLVFLGPGCLRFSRRHVWENASKEILYNGCASGKEFHETYNYLNSLYERLLPQIAVTMNNIHGIKYSQRYWRIIIGDWLLHYIQIIYDRHAAIAFALRKYPDLTTIILDEENHIIPKDINEFFEIIRDDLYNLQIYSRILRRMGYRFPSKKTIKEETAVIPEKSQLFSSSIFNVLTSKFFTLRSKPVFLRSFYLPPGQKVALWAASLGKIVALTNESLSIPSLQGDPEKRNAFKELAFIPQNHMEQTLLSLLPEDIPLVYLEGYSLLKNSASHFWPREASLICSATAWFNDETFKVWAARQAEKGVKLVGAQHGGGSHGTTVDSSVEEHELAITDYYYSWGWERTQKKATIIPGFSVKLSSRNMNPAPSSVTCRKILFVANGWGRYLYRFNKLTNYDIPDYLIWQQRFFSALPKNIFQHVVFRMPANDFGWDNEPILTIAFPELTIEHPSQKAFMSSLEETKLFLCDHLGTTYLEALHLNKPTILYWDADSYNIRPEAKKYFEMLREVGILFNNPEEAALATATAYNDIEKWWNDYKRQESRRQFCAQFTGKSNVSVADWLSSISNLSYSKK